MLATRDTFPFLTELLAEQQRLDTPVARFAASIEAGRLAADAAGAPSSAVEFQSGGSAVGRHPSVTRSPPESQLIPLTSPAPGEQYAFEVELDSCTGCKSCVAACHSLNGLDDDETWRDVGLLVSSDRRHPFTQTITTACHHCADPGCLNGCPVLAYEKDPSTGIVRHLDDQCIGCSYCILKCPYDVPKYSERLGIVRKCDLCHGRLSHGEAPACAQACPTQAIRITLVQTDPSVAAGAGFLPGAPDPAYTRPTTRYISKRGLPPTAVAADHATLRPQPSHWPLVALLMFMPMAVGCQLADNLFALGTPALAIVSWLAGAAGLGLSVGHLGQPRRAWRVFLGLRRSWLSREALVFATWFPVTTLSTAARLGWVRLPTPIAAAFAIATAVLGGLGLFCSARIYADTPREFWRMKHTAPRFFGSAVVLGLASALACCGGGSAASTTLRQRFAVALAAAVLAKLLLETQALEPLKGDRDELTPALKTARLLAGPLRGTNELRAACGLFGGIVLPTFVATNIGPHWLAWPLLAIVALGELLERNLFFRAVVPPKMPGQM